MRRGRGEILQSPPRQSMTQMAKRKVKDKHIEKDEHKPFYSL